MKDKEIEIIVEYGEEELKSILLQEFIKYVTELLRKCQFKDQLEKRENLHMAREGTILFERSC